MECTQRDRMIDMVSGYHQEMKGTGGYLEKYAFFYWEPVKFFEKWCNMFMFAFAKNDFGCIILKFLKAVHSIRSDVSE